MNVNRRRSLSPLVLPAAVGACLVVLAVLVSLVGQGLWAYGDAASGGDAGWESSTTPTTPDSPAAEQVPHRSAQDVQALLSHIPLFVAATCVKKTYPDQLGVGLVVAVSCLPPGFPDPDTIVYLQYESPAAMQAAYDHIVTTIAPGLPSDDGCSTEGGRGSWSRDADTVGSYACYGTASASEWNSTATAASDSVGVRMWWTNDQLGILTVAAGEQMSVDQIWAWFLDSETGPS